MNYKTWSIIAEHTTVENWLLNCNKLCTLTVTMQFQHACWLLKFVNGQSTLISGPWSLELSIPEPLIAILSSSMTDIGVRVWLHTVTLVYRLDRATRSQLMGVWNHFNFSVHVVGIKGAYCIWDKRNSPLAIF